MLVVESWSPSGPYVFWVLVCVGSFSLVGCFSCVGFCIEGRVSALSAAYSYLQQAGDSVSSVSVS